jgi:hypothetical protein
MKRLTLALLSLISTFAFAAEPEFQVGKAWFAGSGCPKDTMSVTWAPDNLSFSVIFDQFVASVGPAEKKSFDRKSCNVIIPMTLPKGLSLVVEKVDFRGFILLPAKGAAEFLSLHNFLPSFGDRFFRKPASIRQVFKGELADDYVLSSDKDVQSSPCGGLVFLNIRNQLTLRAPKGEDGQMTLDSYDGSGRTEFKLSTKKCRVPWFWGWH